VVAHLPKTLRYAAVTPVGDRIVIAGGSLENGTASDEVLVYTPASGRVDLVGRLPGPTTHAAAATLRGIAYVIGGRGTSCGTPTARIVSVDLRTRHVRSAGTLDAPRSDLAAATLGDKILLAGGRDSSGTVDRLSTLVVGRVTRSTAT